MSAIEPHEAFVGACCTWMHTPRGGYGYTIPVDARIIALNLTGTRATIEVKTKAGAVVKRSVETRNLRWNKG